jgi:microcystin-dependent protein
MMWSDTFGLRGAAPAIRGALLLALAILITGVAAATVPGTMTFQGVLTMDEAPFTGAALLGFAIYPDSLAGTSLWSQDAGEVAIVDGLYTVALGPMSDLTFDRDYWLEVSVNGTPLVPRYPLRSVPYAWRAATAERVAAGGVDGASVQDGSLTAADLGVPVVSSVAGVVNHGGDIALVAGENVAITPDDVHDTITISAADGEGGDVTDVFAGAGLTATTPEGPQPTIAVGAGDGIAVTEDAVQLAPAYLTGGAYDSRFVNENQANAVSTAMIVPDVVSSVAGVANDGGDVALIAGRNVTITADAESHAITIAAADGEGGDVTDVMSGPGLVATNATGPQVTLRVGAGDGITVSTNEVSVNPGEGLALDGGRVALDATHSSGSAYDERFVNAGEPGAITTDMLVPEVLTSIAGVANDGGNIALIAGDNVIITADDDANAITIAATGDLTDVFAGAGMEVNDAGGPQVTVSVHVGDGLVANEDGLHVNAPDLIGVGLRQDGANNLAVNPGTGMEIVDRAVQLTEPYITGSVYDDRFVNEAQANSITTAMITPNIVSSISGVNNDGGNIVLVAGDNVTVTADDEENTITIGTTGLVTDVIDGAGLIEVDDRNADITLAVNPGTGLQVSDDAVMLTAAYSSGSALDSRFVNEEGAGTIPIGGIIIWSGAIGSIPSGWALCNGQTANGHTTPDLRNRFVLGAGSGYSVGSTGGESTHILTESEMPSHNHGVTDPGHHHAYTNPNYGNYAGLDHDENGSATEYPYEDASSTGNGLTGISIQYAGGGNAHNTMPPYYALAFIMRVQ